MNKQGKKISKLTVFVLALAMAVTLLPTTAFAADMAGMSGKGTKNDPYIITSVKQLNAVRNDLKAHYKLGNTIDLSSYGSWTPIGNLKTPFRGTITCDTNSDGTPRYIIKNLKVSFSGEGCTDADYETTGKKYTGYREDGSSGWDIGLFGTTSGATLKNIVVLDASAYHGGKGNAMKSGSDYSVNPGMNEMAVGILVGIAKNTKIDGCGVSGTVKSTANHIGGAIGKAEGCTITNSYSYATIDSDGFWGCGGFLGSAESTKVDSCFYSGSFKGGYTHQGAFAGSVYATDSTKVEITNCWAAGTVNDANSGCFLGTKMHSDTSNFVNVTVAKNCYTVAKVAGRNKAMTNTTVTNGNYVTDEIGIFEKDFAVVSKAQLNSIFGAMSAWSASSNGYPQLKNVHPVSNASAYNPGSGASSGSSTGGNVSNTGSSNGETTEENAEPEIIEEVVKNDVENNFDVEVTVQDGYVQMAKQEKAMVTGLIGVFTLLAIASIATIIVVITKNSKK